MDERTAWNRRYAEGDYVPRTAPSPFLEEWLDRLPRGRALVVACGTGRNAMRLAEAGFEVDAVDISEVAIARATEESERRGLGVRWHVSSLDDFEIPAGAFRLVTNIRYRNPHLWPRLVDGLASDGWALVEHHLKSTADVVGPSQPEFRLDPQELLRAFESLRIVYYSEVLEAGDVDVGDYALARLVACKGDPGF
ncbi:MAG: class I SAM-dependent methyltransferase [Acidimicrobiia bacterium]|nr:class I SAM-dependent methyltransferase [Acidimicrobiia bacterium]MBT8215720.1 class I SAM-dependent methyltransferase [Acidimicrobiia bacterium]NNF08737.1 class I SAM-dependent methyltransferase [Acidimicrobiia bacterium]NNL70225.1 class I SAM-dependent methyltransferase [Acidimicrobiia bacterium]